MPVLFLFSMCINRYTSTKQLQFCVPDTDVEQYGGFQKVQGCQKIMFHLSSRTSVSEDLSTTYTATFYLCSRRKNRILQGLVAQERWHTYKFYSEYVPNCI